MMFRPTLRRNGTHMVTVRITHHLDRDNAVRLLCHYGAVYLYDEERLKPLNKSSAEAIIRSELYSHGYYFADSWADSLTEDEAERLEEWAQETLDRMGWPR